MSIPLARLDWSARAINYFDRNRFLYLGQVAGKTLGELLREPNLGRKTATEIQTRLEEYGLSLGRDGEGWSPESARRSQCQQRNPDTSMLGGNDLSSCLAALVAHVATSERNRDLALARLGWTGVEPPTLEVAAQPLNLTRERVRQIVSNLTTALQRRFDPPPTLQRAISKVFTLAPASERDVRASLVAEGLDTGRMTLTGLLEAARIWNLPVRWVRTEIGGIAVALPNGWEARGRQLVQEASRAVSRRGCIAIDQLSNGRSSSEAGMNALARIALAADPSFEPLDDEARWWWKPVGRNRLVNNLRKIMAVAHNLPLSELRDALRRPHRSGHFAPPTAVLASLCARVPGLMVSDRRVRLTDGTDWTRFLSQTEIGLMLVFREYGPVLSRSDFLDRAEGLLSEASLTVASTYSAILWRPAAGHYALIGASIPPGLIEDTLRRRSRTQTNRAFLDTWLPDNRVALAYRLTGAQIRSGILTAPGGFRSALGGGYRLTVDGMAERALEVRDATIWNIRTPLSAMGAEDGDVALLVFDLTKRRVWLRLGGTELHASLAEATPEDVLRLISAERESDDDN